MAKEIPTSGEDIVDFIIPKQTRDDTQRFISVNGERIIAQVGVPLRIKLKFVEVLLNSAAADNAADRYIESNISK